jgi:hypothetical protein
MTSSKEFMPPERDRRLGDLIRSLPLNVSDDDAFFRRLRARIVDIPPRRSAVRRWLDDVGAKRMPQLGIAFTALVLAAGLAITIHTSHSTSAPTGVVRFARASGWVTSVLDVPPKSGTTALVAARFRPSTLGFSERSWPTSAIADPWTLGRGEILVKVSLPSVDALREALAQSAVPRFHGWSSAPLSRIFTARGVASHYRLAGEWGRVPAWADVYIGSRTPTTAQRSIARQELSGLQFNPRSHERE